MYNFSTKQVKVHLDEYYNLRTSQKSIIVNPYLSHCVSAWGLRGHSVS